jgi:Tfp pilus assembly protein PilF
VNGDINIEQATNFYLRNVAVPHDSAPNKEGIRLLEWAVGSNPSYARAWEALGQRYYFDSVFGGGGEEMFQRSKHAYERALSLDSNRVMAASNLITARVERGELRPAYDATSDLVRPYPQSADAHFALAYVYRYAGMLDKSAEQCNSARQPRSRKLFLSLLCLDVPRDGQDGSRHGFHSTGCRL